MGKLITVIPPSPPASPAPWPRIKQIRQFADKLDKLKYHHEQISSWIESLEKATDRKKLTEMLKYANRALTDYENSLIRKELLNEDLKRMYEVRLPVDWWGPKPEDGVLESAMVRAIAEFIGGFPHGVKDPEIFTDSMIEHMEMWQPHYFVWKEACYRMHEDVKYTGSTSELKKTFDEVNNEWTERWDAEECAENAAKELHTQIAEAEKILSIPNGCRVRHWNFGIGTFQEEWSGGDHRFNFVDERGTCQKVALLDLELIETPAIEHKPAVPVDIVREADKEALKMG
jgi:hypothetical protein